MKAQTDVRLKHHRQKHCIAHLIDERHHIVFLTHDATHNVVLGETVLHSHPVDLVVVQANKSLDHLVPAEALQSLQADAQLLPERCGALSDTKNKEQHEYHSPVELFHVHRTRHCLQRSHTAKYPVTREEEAIPHYYESKKRRKPKMSGHNIHMKVMA
jgi:hypothetical protein